MEEETANVIRLGFITWEGTPQELLTTLISAVIFAVVFIAVVKLLIALIAALWRIAFVYCGVPFALYHFGTHMVSEEKRYLPILLCVVYVVIALIVNPFNTHERRHESREYADETPPTRHRRNPRRGTSA